MIAAALRACPSGHAVHSGGRFAPFVAGTARRQSLVVMCNSFHYAVGIGVTKVTRMVLRFVVVWAAVLVPNTSTAQGLLTAEAMNPAVSVARAWWRDFAHGDTVALRAHSTDSTSFTSSIGRNLSQKEILTQAASQEKSGEIPITWSDLHLIRPSRESAIVIQRAVEGAGPTSVAYRYMAALRYQDGGWRVLAAQSTRETALATRVPSDLSGSLEEYAGDYLTPRGLILRVIREEGRLVLVEPSGARTSMEGIGPGIFESSAIPFTGALRFLFTRNDSGKVSSLTRIGVNVVTFERAK